MRGKLPWNQSSASESARQASCYTGHDMSAATNRHAQRLFDGVADSYDLPAQLLSLFQYEGWRRRLVRRLAPLPDDRVMDLCTGTAGVAAEIARSAGCRVAGTDLSGAMLQRARAKVRSEGLQDVIELVRGRAESLPFTGSCFDAVCFTFLLRYVDDPAATIREIVRVLKPGGRLASLEFGIPESPALRVLWHVYARGILRAAAAPISPGWRQVGGFLGPSIARFYDSWSVELLTEMWVNSGIPDVRVERLSFGGAVVMWGTKE